MTRAEQYRQNLIDFSPEDRPGALVKFKAQTLIDAHDLSTDQGREDLIEAAIRWDGEVSDSYMDLYIARFFWPEICRATDFKLELILDHVEIVKAKDRQKKHDDIIKAALGDAVDDLNAGRIEKAKDSWNKALADAEGAKKGTSTKPIRTVKDSLAGLRSTLSKHAGKPYAGMRCYSLPMLDNATLGFQGITLVSALSGEGKTILALQCGLDVAINEPDTCILVLSLDMEEERILLRLLTSRARLPINIVRSGSLETGYTEEEAAEVEYGYSVLEKIGSRLKILDEQNFPQATRSNIVREVNALLRETKTHKCLIILDFIQLLEVPAIIKEPDEWRIEQLRAIIRDLQGQAAIIAIAESRKESGTASRGSASNVKGSYRTVMRSDFALMLESFSDADMEKFFDITDEDYVTVKILKKKKERSAREDDKGQRIRQALAKQDKAPVWLTVDKARDGGKKTKFMLWNHFQANVFSENIHLGKATEQRVSNPETSRPSAA